MEINDRNPLNPAADFTQFFTETLFLILYA